MNQLLGNSLIACFEKSVGLWVRQRIFLSAFVGNSDVVGHPLQMSDNLYSLKSFSHSLWERVGERALVCVKLRTLTYPSQTEGEPSTFQQRVQTFL